MPRETILVTGATGTIGRRVAETLRARGTTVRAATRDPESAEQTRFEWQDPATFRDAAADVRAIFVVAPTGVYAPLEMMQPFLRHALEAGVDRFVLLSASPVERGGPLTGSVHAWLAERARLAVLRPSWYLQNFSEGAQLPSIRDHDEVVSATGDGHVAFVDASDVARVAALACVDDALAVGEWRLTGPSAPTYDDIAAAIGDAAHRQIRHRRLTVEPYAERLEAAGLPNDYARTLAAMDGAIAGGTESETTDAVAAITGRAPTAFDDFVRANAAVWR